ncbi:hypothetical protein Ddc_09570 [Ditylenchus destructor]|nr:hypothetical protein Ddc_09570 [Ditylenchus destructor]
MCFKGRERSKNSNRVAEIDEKRKEEVLVTQNPVPTQVADPHNELRISWINSARKAEYEHNRQKYEERMELEDVIERIRNGMPQSWEAKCRTGEPLTNEEIRDKEIAEAEWRWIARRNFAFRLGKDYQTNKYLEEYMKDMERRGFDEEMRKAQTLVSRPHLFDLMKEEKKAAETRYYHRVHGLPVPTHESFGIEISKIESQILNRPKPEPMCADWKTQRSVTQEKSKNKKTEETGSI